MRGVRANGRHSSAGLPQWLTWPSVINPTNIGPRRFVPRTGRGVWTSPGPPGYLESIQSAGSIAAPLLAGASFTLAALVLQSSTPFGRWQDLALLLLVAAGLAQIFAVQSVIWTRRYMVTPDELRQWLPGDFTDDERPTPWLANVQEFNVQMAGKWAERTRIWINIGISLLLAGIAVGVVPVGHVSGVRWAVIAVSWAGVAVEASWVTAAMVGEPARRGILLNAAAIVISGGATAAAGFAATSGSAAGGSATWWAVALAVVAVPCWLAAVTDARLSHGRMRLRSPASGVLGAAGAAVAVLAPAVFVLALLAVMRHLAGHRHATLAQLHPSASAVLPRGVSLGAHHRAWSQCTAVTVNGPTEAAGLLSWSELSLGSSGQPSPERLEEQVARSPGCVVRVADADDDEVPFGYFIVYPLLAETVRRIRAGQITKGCEFLPAELAASPEATAGWYIAVLWAPGARWTRRCVIATLVGALAAVGAGTAAAVFARPATDPGRSLMQQYGFAPLKAPADAIWVFEKDLGSLANGVITTVRCERREPIASRESLRCGDCGLRRGELWRCRPGSGVHRGLPMRRRHAWPRPG